MPVLTRREAIRATATLAGSLIAARSSSAQPQQPAPRPAHADPRIRLAHLELPSGGRVRIAEMGDASQPVMICLHGYTDSWHSYRLVMPLLAQSHRVIAFDLRGHGESFGRDDNLSLDEIAGDIIGAMQALALDRATVVGHSFGSFVARRMAALNPSRVERLALVGAALTVDSAMGRDLHREVVAQGETITREFAEAFQSSTLLDRTLVPDWFFDACVAASLSVKPRIWREALGGLIADQRVASDVHHRCPTLVIGGERDAVFSADEQRALARAIHGSNIILYRYCGHSPNWEQPGRFAEDIQKFACEST